MSKRLLLRVRLIPAFITPAIAQKYAYPYGNEDKMKTLASQPPASRTEQAITDALNIGDGTNTAKLVFYAGGYKKFLEAVENARMDKQEGAGPSSQGTTSVVATGVAAQVLSLATEQGALTRTDSRVRCATCKLRCSLTAHWESLGSPISPTIGIGYYFQYMVSNALLNLPFSQFAPGTSIPLPGNASELLNTKGSIHLGQAKVTLAIRNTGINFPLALTFSNRTDLLKAPEVRGQLWTNIRSRFALHKTLVMLQWQCAEQIGFRRSDLLPSSHTRSFLVNPRDRSLHLFVPRRFWCRSAPLLCSMP